MGDAIQHFETGVGDGIGHALCFGHGEGRIFGACDHQDRDADGRECGELVRAFRYHAADGPVHGAAVDAAQFVADLLDHLRALAPGGRADECVDGHALQRAGYAAGALDDGAEHQKLQSLAPAHG